MKTKIANESKVAGAVDASSYLYGLVRYIFLDFFTFIVFWKCVSRIRLYRGGGKIKAYFWVQGLVGGSNMAVLGRTYFMDRPIAFILFLWRNFATGASRAGKYLTYGSNLQYLSQWMLFLHQHLYLMIVKVDCILIFSPAKRKFKI